MYLHRRVGQAAWDLPLLSPAYPVAQSSCGARGGGATDKPSCNARLDRPLQRARHGLHVAHDPFTTALGPEHDFMRCPAAVYDLALSVEDRGQSVVQVDRGVCVEKLGNTRSLKVGRKVGVAQSEPQPRGVPEVIRSSTGASASLVRAGRPSASHLRPFEKQHEDQTRQEQQRDPREALVEAQN